MPILKLDKEDVAQIKFLCKSTTLIDREIADLFGVSRKHINAIRNKQRWNYEYEREFDLTRINFYTEE